LFAERVPIAAEFAQLPAAWVDLERGNLDQVEARVMRMVGGVRTIGVATFTMAVCLIQARWRERVGDPRGALEALDEADRVNGDLFEPGRPDRLILRARVASRLGDTAMVSDVHRDLRDLIERGGGGIISAGADWAQGLRAERTGQARDARRRLQAAAEKCQQASRFVLAVEAWCDLAAAARSDDERDIRRLAIESGRRIARERGFVALRARLDELAGDDSGEPAWPPVFDVLTPRQRDIALLVAAGRTNRQIGQQLYLSEHTVRNQLVDVFIRLGVERRAEIGALIHSTQPARS
jgi:DNA-binding CsgD family transcriptional regulator